MLNVATLTATGIAAAAGSILARAGLSTVADANATKLKKAQAKLVEQDKKLKSVKKQYQQQTSRLEASKRQVASQSGELAQARQEMDRQRRSISDLSGQNDRLTRKISDLETVRYRGSIRTTKDAVSDFARRMSRRTTVAAGRNLATIPAEAIPIFGIAVIIGATTWELNDSCGMMQDIHELNVAFDPSLENDTEHLEVCGMKVPTRAEVWDRVKSAPAETLSEHYEHLNLPSLELPKWWNWLISRAERFAAIMD
ncbi:hypothetical protein [Palleronia aestuarii]|nr:hypothetical protein [Palleronia aestuarii]